MSHSQLQVLFLLTVESFSIFSCKHNQSDLDTDHLVVSMHKAVCWIVGKGVCYVRHALLTKLR